MPKLKLKMESILHMFLIDELTDVGFKEACQALLNEFEGKNLLHQNIGQLTWEMEKKNPSKRNRFKKIWILLDQVSPRIREDFDRRMENGPNRKSQIGPKCFSSEFVHASAGYFRSAMSTILIVLVI